MNKTIKNPSAEKKLARTNVEDRYGPNITNGGGGFTYIPNVLFLMKKDTQLTDEELLIFMQYLREYNSLKDTKTKISSKYISQRNGKSPRAIQRAIKGLKEKGWIKSVEDYHPVPGGNIRSYDLMPGINKIDNLAKLWKKNNEKKKMEAEDLMEERLSTMDRASDSF